MRVKTGQASSKYLGTLIFFLLLFLNEVFPSAAFAFTSLNTCARSKECLELIRGSSSSAVSAPTGAGYGITTLRTTTSSGVIKTFVNGVADFAIVVGPSTAYVSWHYWDEAHNGRAQERAKQRYCAAYPTDVVCTPFIGGQCEGVGYEYGWEAEFIDPNGKNYGYFGNTAGNGYWSYSVWGPIKGIRAVGNTIEVLARGHYSGQLMPDPVWVRGYSTGNTTTLRNARFRNMVRWGGSADNCGNPPPFTLERLASSKARCCCCSTE